MEFISSDLSSLKDIAKSIVEILPKDAIVLLEGPMGSGKTTLVGEMCSLLEIEGTISSPTFSIVNEYHTKSGRIIYHFDFYRIESIEEVFDIGLEEYLDSGNLCLMEWPEKIEELLPENSVRIRISEADGQRLYKVDS